VACLSMWTLIRSALVAWPHAAVTMLPGISCTVYPYWNMRIAVGVQFSLAALILLRDSALRPWKEFQNTAVRRVHVNSR
jgi:hypothetical protein